MKTKITGTYHESSFMSVSNQTKYSIRETISRIIELTEGLTDFWKKSDRWAPLESIELLTKSRLDWQVSLAKQLILFEDELSTDSGRLILAWATLGSLTEGSLKLFLSVHLKSYQAQDLKDEFKPFTDKKNNIISPDELMLDKLRIFFSKYVLPQDAKETWKKSGEINWIDWILKIQQRRNAIHAFKDREIGDINEFHSELKNYLLFLRKINNGLPYPDDIYKPKEYFLEGRFEEISLASNGGPFIKGVISKGRLIVETQEDGEYLKRHLNRSEEIKIW